MFFKICEKEIHLYLHGNDPVEKEKLMTQDRKERTPLIIQKRMGPRTQIEGNNTYMGVRILSSSIVTAGEIDYMPEDTGAWVNMG